MSYLKLFVHIIWSTKNREKVINDELKPVLIDHIKSNCAIINIHLDTVNCVEDHIHLLISQDAEQSISKIVQLIKGESAHWINQNNLIATTFEWQNEYMAISVSPLIIDRVRVYIKNQEKHHSTVSYDEEEENLIQLLWK